MAYTVNVVSYCIDSSLLGTENNLLCSEGTFTWVPTVPDDVYHLSGEVKPLHDRCLDTVFALNGISIDLSPPKRFVTAMQLVMSGSSVSPPWQKVMPLTAHRAFMKHLVDSTVVAMAKADMTYYEGTWVPGNAVIRSLQPAKVNASMVSDLVASKVHNAYVIETFRPGKDGFAPRVSYDRFGTLTGRCTVSSGPSIQTLKKDYRNIIESVYGEKGRIVQLDFSSLEPRVLLYEAGRRCEDNDLYSSIASDLGYDRKSVKGAVISELYGSSKFTLGKTLGIEGKELDSFVERVATYFNTGELLQRVKKQFFETGRMVNRYGRLINVDEPLDNVFINYYAQSSAADVALLGFSKIVSELATEAPRVRPLFLIYDALLLDVHEDDLAIVEKKTNVKVQGYVQRFPIKVETVSCTSNTQTV